MIIGLVGFIGSGKDTVADMLTLSPNWTRESFAKPLKDATSIIFGWDRKVLEGTTKEDRAWREQPDAFWSSKFGKSFTPRRALQLMGTEVGRDVFHQNLWVDALEKRLFAGTSQNVVVTDVRFVNEMEMITRLGGTVVRILRGTPPSWYAAAQDVNCDRALFGDTIASNTLIRHPELQTIHISEWGWIGSPLITYQIDNNHSLDDLKKQVSVMIECLANN